MVSGFIVSSSELVSSTANLQKPIGDVFVGHLIHKEIRSQVSEVSVVLPSVTLMTISIVIDIEDFRDCGVKHQTPLEFVSLLAIYN